MFAADVHQKQLSEALVRHRALRVASDQGLQHLSLHKTGFADCVTFNKGFS